MWDIERHDAHDMDNPCADHSHAMVFHSCVCADILFKGWSTTNAMQLFGSAVAIFVAAVVYEAFKLCREQISISTTAKLKESQKNSDVVKPLTTSQMMLNCGHVTQSLLHLVQSTFSYLLMLVFMSYNVWLCLAVVLGLTFGYFLFGWRRSLNDANEHCC